MFSKSISIDSSAKVSESLENRRNYLMDVNSIYSILFSVLLIENKSTNCELGAICERVRLQSSGRERVE